MQNTAQRKKRDPRIGGPGPCAICRTYRGGRTLTLSKFFRGGPVPDWAVVHAGCNRREKPAQFRERLQRWLAERTGQAVPTAGEAVAERRTAEDGGGLRGTSGPL